MRPLFASQQPQLLYTFRDYIQKTYGVTLEIMPVNEPEDRQYLLIMPENCHNETQILAEMQTFAQNPHAAKYSNTSWEQGELLPKQPLMQWRWRREFWQAKTYQKIPFTVAVTLLCILVYLAECWTIYVQNSDIILQALHYPANAVQQSELWRYVSHAIVHLGLWHLAFNLCFWWIFAGAIERQLGSIPLILLTFTSAIISGMSQNYFSGADFFGLSGVVYAVLGFVLIEDKFAAKRFHLPDGFLTMLIVGLALGFIAPTIGIQIGNAAHISGFVVGVLFSTIDILRPQK